MTTTAPTTQTTHLPLPHRRFGKTGERVPLLGLGTAPEAPALGTTKPFAYLTVRSISV